ncbi:cytochrome P450 [Lentzea nigeriaca]|uniref:cytochrome P450 n=1 Tax=Lentzea nigeriaca TaxID=1128665 RepID=UPI0035560D80
MPAGSLVLLDLHRQNHDSRLWTDPYRFDPQRFLDREIGAWDLVPQGAGDPHTGHRCPASRSPSHCLSRIPARPRCGFRLIPATARQT